VLRAEDYSDVEEDGDEGGCPLCERLTYLTWHHLRPRTTHKRLLRKGFTKEILNQGIQLSHGVERRVIGVWVCRQCHSGIHNNYDQDTLADRYTKQVKETDCDLLRIKIVLEDFE